MTSGRPASRVPDRPVAVYTDVVQFDPGDGVRLLEEAGFDVRVVGSDDPEVIAATASDATALLIGYSRVDARLLDALPRLRIIATQSAGTDTVDVAEAGRRGIWVGNVPDAAVEEVATHALAMTLSLLRGLPFLDREVRRGGWDGTTETLRRPSETTLGVLGLGRIGRRLADLAAPVLGAVAGHDPAMSAAESPTGVRHVELDELLATSDVLSLHLPLTEETRHVIGRDEFAAMRPGAYLVNVSRGGVVDQSALLEELDAGHLGGAALDVLADEPPHAQDPVRTHPRVLLSPHVAYLSAASARDYVLRQAQNVAAWHRTGQPDSPVAGPPGR